MILLLPDIIVYMIVRLLFPRYNYSRWSIFAALIRDCLFSPGVSPADHQIPGDRLIGKSVEQKLRERPGRP